MASALVCLCLVAGAAGAAGPTGPKAHRPLLWGAWIGKQITGNEPPWDMSAVSRFQETVGKGLSMLEFSSPFFNCHTNPCTPYKFPTTPMQSIREYGAIPFLSWTSSSSSGAVESPEFQLADVISGSYDTYIREFAEAARNWGHPFFLRFDWEMNGNWFPWGEGVNGNQPGEYVAAWRHVHEIFTSVGATNASWVWCPYAHYELSKTAYAQIKADYPGSEYVDWSCMDGYNWGPLSPEPAPWRSFETIFKPTYEFLTKKVAPEKPVMLAEFASSGSGTAKATWISRMFASLGTTFRRIRGLIWLEKDDRGVEWPLETSEPPVEAFRLGLQKGFRPNIYSEQTESPITPPERLSSPAQIPTG